MMCYVTQIRKSIYFLCKCYFSTIIRHHQHIIGIPYLQSCFFIYLFCNRPNSVIVVSRIVPNILQIITIKIYTFYWYIFCIDRVDTFAFSCIFIHFSLKEKHIQVIHPILIANPSLRLIPILPRLRRPYRPRPGTAIRIHHHADIHAAAVRFFVGKGYIGHAAIHATAKDGESREETGNAVGQ